VSIAPYNTPEDLERLEAALGPVFSHNSVKASIDGAAT
jgi:hypothetical protein